MELAVSHWRWTIPKDNIYSLVLSEDTRQRSGIGNIYRNEKIFAEREWYCIPKRSVIFDAMFAHGEQMCIDHSRVKREEEKVSVRAKVAKLCFPWTFQCLKWFVPFMQKKRGTPLWRASGLRKNAHFASWRIPQSHLSMSERETRLHGTTMWVNSFYEHQDIQMTTSREFVAARSLSCDRCPTVLCITSLRSHGRLRRENIDRPPVHTEAYR